MKEKRIQGIEFAYSLARDCIALHFSDSKKAEVTTKDWPGAVFGEKESVHPPAGSSKQKIHLIPKRKIS